MVEQMLESLQNGGSMAYQETLSLQLFGGSRKLLDELLGEAHAASFPSAPGVSILTARQDCWVATSWQPKPPLLSLILAEGVLEDVLADMRGSYRSATFEDTATSADGQCPWVGAEITSSP